MTITGNLYGGLLAWQRGLPLVGLSFKRGRFALMFGFVLVLRWWKS